MTIVLLVISIGLVLWAVFILRSLSEMVDETLSLVRRMGAVLAETVGSLIALSDDLAAHTRSQKAALNDVVGRLEKEADRSMYSARRVANDLADREEKVDADIAAATQRADETVGEPGAAADAAAKTPEDPE
jgi:hypothetical protein